VAFSLYLLDGWRQGGGIRTLALVPSRFGALAGVGNYVVAGLAALALAHGPGRLDAVVQSAGSVTALLNVLAILERSRILLGRTLKSCARHG
jgi:hypothetical protein